jgi:hypothetical protein
MGIYVQSFADLPGAAPEQGWLSHVIALSRTWAAQRGLEEFFYASCNGEEAHVTFYPVGGTFMFKIDGDRISLESKTSIAGPAFHAALIDLCDSLERSLFTRWRWDAGGDESEYALHRDRARLERAFIKQFEAYCDLYRRKGDSEEAFVLNLPTDLAFGGHTGVATPTGPFPLAHFIYDDPAESEAKAKTVFPWWNSALDEAFWQSTLKALLWSEVEWRTPRTPWETFVARAALHAFTRIKTSPTLEIGLAAAELLGLQRSTDHQPPKADAPGWRRRPRGYYLPGPWRIVLPGYYADDLEDDGQTTCVWFGDEEVRGSSFTLSLKTPGVIPWSKAYEDSEEVACRRYKYRLRPPQASQVEGFSIAFAECHALDDEGLGQVLTLSLFSSREDPLQRLDELARAVFFDPPQALRSTRGDA